MGWAVPITCPNFFNYCQLPICRVPAALTPAIRNHWSKPPRQTLPSGPSDPNPFPLRPSCWASSARRPTSWPSDL